MCVNLDLDKLLSSFTEQIKYKSIDKCEAIKLIRDHLRLVNPNFNVMIVHSKHIHDFKDFYHKRIELKILSGSVSYDVYVFKSGYFSLIGNGGLENWCFGGYFKRKGKHVEFYDHSHKFFFHEQ